MRLVLVSLAALPFAPLFTFEWTSIPFLVLFTVCLGAALWRFRRLHAERSGRWVLLFLVLCTLHMINPLLGLVAFEDYVRGVIPFLYVSSFFVGRILVGGKHLGTLATAIIVLGAAYSVEHLLLWRDVLGGALIRTTFETSRYLVPFPLMAFHICVQRAQAARRLVGRVCYAGLAAVLLFAMVLTGMKMLLIAAILPMPFLLYIGFRSHAVSGKAVLGYAAAAAAVLAVVWAVVPTATLVRTLRLELMEDAITQERNDGSYRYRELEMGLAWDIIQRNPVAGIGLGARFDIPWNLREGAVAYIHNSYLYLIMDFGLTGLLYFAPFAAAIASAGRSLTLDRTGHDVMGLAGALIAFVIMAAGFVIIRLIPVNVVAFMVAGAMEARRLERAPRALSRPAVAHAY